MKFGVCTDPANAPALAKAGFDFIEVGVQGHLKPLDSDEVFRPILAKMLASPLPCWAANGFVPGSLKITGPAVDPTKLKDYVTVAFRRAKQAGIRNIVFGSGGARQIPDGFDRAKAYEQLLDFGRMIAPLAVQAGVTIAVEPLNKKECNVFTAVGECARYVQDVNHPGVRLLVDAYHWTVDHDSVEDLVKAGPLLRHAHIATGKSRMAPSLEPHDFSSFAAALKQGGYDGLLSVEGQWGDMAAQAPQVLAEMKRMVA